MPKVCLITVCFNDLPRLPGFVDSLARLNYDNFEHVLVDNNSQDGSVGFLRKSRPSIHVLEPKTNLVTTLGYNLAIRKALEFKPDYILYSAIDVVLDPDCLTRQVELMESDPKIGIVGPVLFLHNEPSIVQSFGFKTQPKTMFAESTIQITGAT
jgi:GT2 family glycosyltransferase